MTRKIAQTKENTDVKSSPTTNTDTDYFVIMIQLFPHFSWNFFTAHTNFLLKKLFHKDARRRRHLLLTQLTH